MSPQPNTLFFDIITIPHLCRDMGIVIGFRGVISSRRSYLTISVLSLRFNYEGFAMSFMSIAKPLAFALFTVSGSRFDRRVAFGSP